MPRLICFKNEQEQVTKDFKDVPLVPREAGFGPLALGGPGSAAHLIAGLLIPGQCSKGNPLPHISKPSRNHYLESLHNYVRCEGKHTCGT